MSGSQGDTCQRGVAKCWGMTENKRPFSGGLRWSWPSLGRGMRRRKRVRAPGKGHSLNKGQVHGNPGFWQGPRGGSVFQEHRTCEEEKCQIRLAHVVWMKVGKALSDNRVWVKGGALEVFEQFRVTIMFCFQALDRQAVMDRQRGRKGCRRQKGCRGGTCKNLAGRLLLALCEQVLGLQHWSQLHNRLIQNTNKWGKQSA